MSQAPVSDQTARGFEPPRNTQFSVFVDNHVGRLLEVIEVFHGKPLVLAGLSVVDSADHSVVRLLTSHGDLARRLLERHQLPFSEVGILAVELGEGKTLAEMCRCLLAAELSIHYAYPLLVRPRGLPAIAIHTDDPLLSAQILRRKLFTLLGENDLGDNASRNTPGSPNGPGGPSDN
jgi:hypothetical protein